MIRLKPEFEVLTVSKRADWEQIAVDSLNKQTVQGFRWHVVSEEELDTDILHSSKNTVHYQQAPDGVRRSNLNASLNAGLRNIEARFVIFYQDWIELPEDCFEKLLALADDDVFVTTCTPNYDGSDDGRYTGLDAPRMCPPAEWETNVAIAPMKILKKLGGFDEEYDNGWSWDNVNVAERAAMLGCKFMIDESNRPKLFPHEQEDKHNLPLNAERHQRIMYEIRAGRRPLECNYL